MVNFQKYSHVCGVGTLNLSQEILLDTLFSNLVVVVVGCWWFFGAGGGWGIKPTLIDLVGLYV